MKRAILIASAAAAAGIASAPAAAETLNVQGIVAPYCNVSLANVSSGTATIAMLGEQKIANLTIRCNAASGTRLTVDPQNGDLLSSAGNRINYAFRTASPTANFVIAETDTAPGNTPNQGIFVKDNPGFSTAVANGTPLELFMNVNVQNEVQPDFNVANQYPASGAPAGSYNEVFTFTVSQI